MATGSSRHQTTAFDYRSMILPDQVTPTTLGGTAALTYGIRKVGGDVIPLLLSQTPFPNWGDLVAIDIANDDSVIQAQTSTSGKLVIGICVGQRGRSGDIYGPNCFSSDFGVQRVGQRIWVQVAGIATVVADGAINRGDTLTLSPLTAGRVGPGNAATIGNIIGQAITAASGAGVQFRMLIRPY